MSWDSRGYYYRHRRVNGQPRRVYVGAGYVAQLAAKMDEHDQAQRQEQDNQWRLQRAKDRADNKVIDAQYHQLREYVAALLTAVGYYQHKREWRKMGKKVAQLTTAADSGQPLDLQELVERTNEPNPSRADLAALKAALAAQNDGDGPVLSAVDAMAVLKRIVEAATNSEASRMVIEADAARMAKTLGRDICPAFERSLIDHIVLCWVRLQLVELDVTRNIGNSHSREAGAYWDRRLTEAQRRYLRAINQLAKVRNMGLLQVNIANQQIVSNR